MSGQQEIRFEDVCVEFAGRAALREVSITLNEKRIGVIGSNGSGKSTFARLFNGLVSPTRGRVMIHGLDPLRDGRRLRQRVGFIFSNPDAQIVMPTVTEDLAFSLRGRGLTRAEVDGRVTSTIAAVDLGAHAEASTHGLSSGQKQLLALGAILIGEPDLVVADEPTAMLDASNSRKIGNRLLDEIPQQLVLVTHDLRLAARCDVVLRFKEGMLLEHGDPRSVIARYERDHP
ncbi:energy-coupling factor ABC transporter ATP-binding protein [Frigoribacterium sp. CG_9.8]|uniref:energy-coupling factor ABC transporter ATP-binding protein n=1 Tax=Frigoribacterium sp. CG_9.8 TaxID=2787733 RepID=UPI0018CBDA79|nr:ABC transporter ATP-binding protein [Frigoribacterium sp. CG_9.8]MBG6108157.1 biotin transport system ATP-binding protein [Frigoribacterium sp. CG_9.8]